MKRSISHLATELNSRQDNTNKFIFMFPMCTLKRIVLEIQLKVI